MNYLSIQTKLLLLSINLKTNIYSYIKIGILAKIVKVQKLWKEVNLNFNEFCKTILGKSTWWVNRAIAV